MGNLGRHPDGRTILIDWAYPGSGPACWDLCWYLALNQARIPETKEATTSDSVTPSSVTAWNANRWFETQLDLCLIGIMATFGWEKALGEEEELRWWEERVVDALARREIDANTPAGRTRTQ